ncbi:PAS domain S-box-containing protein/diguanylate cyclase (GGDEF) domain-containing protein [Malonomonas rubra DSM 5091]|uniref:PAS domain S-box-containing protein/diguanylate cyclase (GGDEF) domain-containing protein n=1 Tax=Malonomonas rubra DSM 5091 TaxID=1122189 RepID=A0A1M6EWW3_MALRU|nr:diguanylate cyclase [Malonomonas rubra]SHI89861.1 PAS domain S-box-containing protein/diguanylate cyclase (GGDEF) domain-containing protein [Malonomonas rubra DSM 5091]
MTTELKNDPCFQRACKHVVGLLSQLRQADATVGQAELKQAFEQLTDLIDQCDDLIWFVNRQMQLLLANGKSRDSFFELLDGDPRPGLLSSDLLSPNAAEYFDQLYRRVLSGTTMRFNHTGTNGRVYAMVLQPIQLEGEALGVSVLGHDITEVHRLEEHLRRFELLISSTPDLIALIDREYRHLVVNDSYIGAFNKTRDEVLKLDFRDLIGRETFHTDVELHLEIAFSGETVLSEFWLDLPELGRRLMSVTFQPLRGQDLTSESVVINYRDITAEKQAEDDRQRVFDVSLDMLCVTDFSGHFKELNRAWSRILGWSADELKQKPWLDLVLEEDRDVTRDASLRLNQGDTLVGFENRCRCKDGSFKWLSWSAYPDMERKLVFSVIRDISTSKQMEEELRHLATTDPLTGANNRRYFIDHVNTEVKRCRRHGMPLAILQLDVDHFKSVNDSYGHDIGDEVLIKLVDCCLGMLRETDLFCRFGGEEFAAALVQTDQDGAMLVCERIREAIAEMTIRTRQGELSVTASIGLTMLTADDLSIDSVLKRADNALYRAKNNGRDQVVLV